MTSGKNSKGSGRGEEHQTGCTSLEKRIKVQDSMALRFDDLEKAFDTLPREMVIAMLRWMGVLEVEVRTLREHTRI